MRAWSRQSYKNFPSEQELIYEDKELFESEFAKLSSLPPLVFAGEVNELKKKLAKACEGSAFVLQGGDCAESFANFSSDKIRDDLKLLLQMAVILAYESSKPIIKIGRFAGQFAKPRSKLTQTIAKLTLPSYRGDIINDIAFDKKARTPDPKRMIKAYHQSAATLNLVRAFMSGGLASLDKIHGLNLAFTKKTQSDKYKMLCANISKALAFVRACGQALNPKPAIYTSHEALHLAYEEALTRKDSMSGLYYNCSAHMLWLGARTNRADHAHAQLLSGVENPIGVKVSSKTKIPQLQALAKLLNPTNEPGKLSFIFRMGVKDINSSLPPILASLREQNIVYICDPMHANTKIIDGQKTRIFEDILAESQSFFSICQDMGVKAGGLHLEMSGQEVTECIGGVVGSKDLHSCFTSLCDPRLNATQALDFAFKIARYIY